MRSQWEVYDLMLDHASAADKTVEEVLIGVNWTFCRAGGMGLSRTLADRHWQRDWTGSLAGRPLGELAGWIRKWERQHAAIGLAAINAALSGGGNNRRETPEHAESLIKGSDAIGAILKWFSPRMRGQRAVVVGEGGLWSPENPHGLSFLPTRGGALSPLCEDQVSVAQWVFISGHCIADKTLPRLLELAGDAQVVLFGAGVPSLREFHDFGVDYLASAHIDNPEELRLAIAEGAEPQSVNGAVHYRITALRKDAPLHAQRRRVAAG